MKWFALLAAFYLNSTAHAKLTGDHFELPPLTDSVATTAVLFDVTDQGERTALCQLDVAGRPELVPHFLKPIDQQSEAALFELPLCSADQTEKLAALAQAGEQPQYAGLPLAIGAACIIDATLTTAAVAATNYSKDEQKQKGALMIMGAWAMRGQLALTRSLIAIPGFAAIGLVCGAAGAAAGYWLVPGKLPSGIPFVK